MFLIEIRIQNVVSILKYNVPFLRHVTSKKANGLYMFLKWILHRLTWILVHTLSWPILCTLQKIIHRINVTNVSIPTNIPIIKHITLICSTAASDEDISLKFIPDTYTRQFMDFTKIMTLNGQGKGQAKFKVKARIFWLGNGLLYLKRRAMENNQIYLNMTWESPI